MAFRSVTLGRLAPPRATRTGGQRARYVGLTTSAAQLIDVVTGTVSRNIGTGWAGERLLDPTPGGTNIRIYGI